MRLYLILIFIFLGACTSLPSAIEEAQVEDVSYYQVSADLDRYSRPQINKPSAGHFVIKSSEFLDAEVYATDREIAAVGAIDNETGHTFDSQNMRRHK